MRASPAFSLIETVIVVALFSILLIALLSLFGGFGTIFNNQQSQINTYGDAREIVDIGETMILQANRILLSRTFASITLNTGTSTLVLELPAINASGDVLAGSFDYVGMYASGTEAYAILETAGGSARKAATRILSNTLEGLRFTYAGASYDQSTFVTIEATTSDDYHGKTFQTHLKQKVFLRNTTL